MIKTEHLRGQCPCCGQAVGEIEYFFHAQTGTLIVRGKVFRLAPTESVAFDMMRKSYPEPVSLDAIHGRLCAGRGNGGVSRATVQVSICNMRGKMRAAGFRIPNSFGKGMYALQIIEDKNVRTYNPVHLLRASPDSDGQQASNAV